MTNSYAHVRNAILAANPVPITDTNNLDPLSARAERDLADIISQSPARHEEIWLRTKRSGPQTARTPLRSRRIILGAAVAAAVSIVAVTETSFLPGLRGNGQTTSTTRRTPEPLRYQLAASSSLTVSERLKQISERVAGLTDDIGSGKYAHVSMQSWSLVTSVRGESATSEIVPSERTWFVAKDGSGRTLTTAPDGKSVESDAPSLIWPLGSLSSDDSTLAQQLGKQHPASNGPAERLVAIHDAYRQMPLPPPVRAAILRYLAATPSLSYSGEAIDRAGRKAQAFSVESDYSGLPARYTLLFDERTGALLDYEEMLTERAGKLNVRVPSVISYMLIMSAGYTNKM